MNRNQKIALGCGGAGCLVLILIVVVGAILYMVGYVGSRSMNSNYNYNYNTNTNRNSNYNYNLNRNSNTNTSGTPSSSMSSDDKHKLYQAAGMTKDSATMLRVLRKIGLGDGSGSDHQQFIKEHFSWAMKNLEFIQSVNTPEKARAYVDEHIDD